MAKNNEKKIKTPEKKSADQPKADVTMFLGDSNMRNTYMAYKKIIDDKFGENIFEQATTNETIKIMLSGCNIDQINKVYVGSILNEVGWRCRPLAPGDRDETQLKIVREQVDLINEFSKANPTLKFIILCPLTRGDPDWIEEKIPEIMQQLKEEFAKIDNDQITFAPPTTLEAADVGKDKVHLTQSGMKKYIESIIGKLDEDAEEEMDQDSTDWTASTSTPGKRNLQS